MRAAPPGPTAPSPHSAALLDFDATLDPHTKGFTLTTLLGACAAICRGYATSRYYRPLVLDGTPSKLAERFYERKVLTGSHDTETFNGWRVRPTPKIRKTVSQLPCLILLQIHQT